MKNILTPDPSPKGEGRRAVLALLVAVGFVFCSERISAQCSTTAGGTICDSTKSFTSRGILNAQFSWQSKVIPQTGRNYVSIHDSVTNSNSKDMLVMEIYTCGTNDLQLNISPGYAMSEVKYNLNNENCGGSANNERVIIYGKASGMTVNIMKNNCGGTTDTVTIWYRKLASYPSNADNFGNPDAGAGYWKGTVYKWNNVPGYYYNNLGTTGNRSYNFTLDTGTVVPITNGCSVCPTAATTDSFTVRFRMDTIQPRGFYKVTCNTANDLRLTTHGNINYEVMDYWTNGSSSSTKTMTSLFVPTGTNTYHPYTGAVINEGQWVYYLKKDTGNFKADITICQMDGDYTWGNNVWNAYVFDGNGTLFNNYIGQFGTSTPFIGYNWTSGQPSVNNTACSQSMDDSLYKVNFLMKYNFAAGNYKFRIRSYKGGQTMLTDRKGVIASYIANYSVNNNYDVTSAYNYLSGDTFLIIKVYEQGGTKSISYNHCRQPKDVGHLSLTLSEGEGINGSDTVCNGNTVTLTADTVDGTETQWWKGATCGTGTLIGTGASIDITPDSSTTFYVRNRNYCVNSNDTLNKIDLFSANCTSRRITLVSKPGVPTDVTPSSATAICSGASLNLNGTSSGNTIYWFAQSSGGSAIGNSASGGNYSVSPSASITYYAESKAGTGCVSATRTATGAVTVNANPSAPYFTWGDTLLFVDSVNNICYFAEDTDSVTIHYSIWSGNALIDSVSGCLSSHDSSNFTVRATARNGFGCQANANKYVVVTSLKEPIPPLAQEANTDTPYTFVFSDIEAGSGGDQIEWAYNDSFNNSTILSSPATISVTVNPFSDTIIWFRSRNSTTRAVSRYVATKARAIYFQLSSGLLDKTNWDLDVLGWKDEFDYNNFDITGPPQNFIDHWNYYWINDLDCDRMIGCSDQTSMRSGESDDEISIASGVLHLKGHTITPFDVTCTDCPNGDVTHNVKYLTGYLESNIGLDNTPTVYDANCCCWGVNEQFYKGMFEIRCKLPSGVGATSAFWLWEKSELDIMETKVAKQDDLRAGSSSVHDWDDDNNCGLQGSGDEVNCTREFRKAIAHDYSEDFHTYSCVWGDSRITYFVDGKETWSETDEVPHPMALTIVLSLVTFDAPNQPTDYDFAVDYVRVYKPVSTNTDDQCLQNINNSEAKTLDGSGSPLLVNNTWSSQTYSTSISLSRMRTDDIGNDIKVYYRGTDGRCYNSYQSGGNWYEYPLMWNVTDVGDDVTPFDDRVYYRAVINGVESGLKYFEWNSNTGLWENYPTAVTNCGGFVNITNAGTVLYKGYDDDNLYSWNETDGVVQITDDGSLNGGLIVDGCGCLVFYRDFQNKLRQWYWWDDEWHDVGQVVTTGLVTNHLAYDKDNSIVYFIGSDKKIYSYAVTYSSVTTGGLQSLYNMLGDDNAVSDLVLSPDKNMLYYIGDNGQIWYYFNDLEDGAKATGRWFRSTITYPFASAPHNTAGTLCMDESSGRLFYSFLYGSTYKLFATDWRNANVACPCPASYADINVFYKTDETDTPTESAVASPENIAPSEKRISVAVYPNPSGDRFIFTISGSMDGMIELLIEDLDGRKIYSKRESLSENANVSEITFDASTLNNGVYIYKLKSRGKTTTGKLVKM